MLCLGVQTWFDIMLLGLSKLNVATYALLVESQLSAGSVELFPIENCTNVNPRFAFLHLKNKPETVAVLKSTYKV